MASLAASDVGVASLDVMIPDGPNSIPLEVPTALVSSAAPLSLDVVGKTTIGGITPVESAAVLESSDVSDESEADVAAGAKLVLVTMTVVTSLEESDELVGCIVDPALSKISPVVMPLKKSVS
jgi:hypothetical protein